MNPAYMLSGVMSTLPASDYTPTPSITDEILHRSAIEFFSHLGQQETHITNIPVIETEEKTQDTTAPEDHAIIGESDTSMHEKPDMEIMKEKSCKKEKVRWSKTEIDIAMRIYESNPKLQNGIQLYEKIITALKEAGFNRSHGSCDGLFRRLKNPSYYRKKINKNKGIFVMGSFGTLYTAGHFEQEEKKANSHVSTKHSRRHTKEDAQSSEPYVRTPDLRQLVRFQKVVKR
jgi:hypothetical protein